MSRWSDRSRRWLRPAFFALAAVSLASRVVETNAAAVRTQALVLAVGKLGIVAAFEPTTVR